MNIVIMAGGSGTRLWPMSRKNMPKQLQKLVGDRTLIQQTFDRIRDLAKPEEIFVGTVGAYAEAIKHQLPELPETNLIIEPELKNNAAAIGLAAVHLHHRDPHSLMVSLHSDHVVSETANFHQAIRVAAQVVNDYPQTLVTVGIKPTNPSTELGYIQMDGLLAEIEGQEVFKVKKFIEKPDLNTAQKFVANWQYLWNAGYFVWRVDTLLALYQEFLPNTYQRLKIIEQAIDSPDYQKVLSEQYKGMDEVAVDVAIMERAPAIAVVPADLGWSDVGTWSALHDILSSMTGSHLIVKGHHTGVDCENCLVYAGEKMIATVGLKDVIIVDTPDVILVANKTKAHQIKQLLEKLKEEGKHLYL